MDTLDTKAVENGLVSDFKHGATGLFAILDGKPLHNLKADLVRTNFFSAGPTLAGSWANDVGVAVGTDLAPTKGAGFWIVIEGLAKGNHTLEFGGIATSTNFSAHTTDNIHIA